MQTYFSQNTGIEHGIGWELHLGAQNILIQINTLTNWEMRGDIRNCLLSIIVFLNYLIIHDQWMVQTLLRCLISVCYIALQHLQSFIQCAFVWWLGMEHNLYYLCLAQYCFHIKLFLKYLYMYTDVAKLSVITSHAHYKEQTWNGKKEYYKRRRHPP